MSLRYTTQQFIDKSLKIHSGKYIYNKINYIDMHTKVCIICPEHGEFWQSPILHIKGCGCPKCNPKRKLSQEEIINRFKTIHGNKYDYSKVIYKNTWSPVKIECPKHGVFMQLPCNHLKGQGCPKCSKQRVNESKYLSQEEIINRFKTIHGNKYDYSKVIYNGIEEKVCIICPEHGEFWQRPHTHMNGCGCPKCNSSKLENKIHNLLLEKNIEFIYQYYPEFLNFGKSHMSLDFFLPKYNIAIECQGKQHFYPINHFGGVKEFIDIQQRDIFKYNVCKNNNINILYFADKKYTDDIYTNINDLYDKLQQIFEETEKI